MSRILVIDDTEFNRVILKEMLKTMGHEVVGEAENGSIGYSLYRILRPDVLITDMIMPEITGLELIEKVRKTDSLVGIILISTSNPQIMEKEALNAGADAFLSKPISYDRLRTALKECVNNKYFFTQKVKEN